VFVNGKRTGGSIKELTDSPHQDGLGSKGKSIFFLTSVAPVPPNGGGGGLGRESFGEVEPFFKRGQGLFF